MRRALEILLPGLLVGLAIAQTGCQSDGRPWTEPEENKVRVVSDAAFVRTDRGDYIDGYVVEYESEFQPCRMFMAVELPRYVKGDRLLITGRPTGDFVRLPSADPAQGQVPVFEVEKAGPDVPKAPDVPPIKSAAHPSSLLSS